MTSHQTTRWSDRPREEANLLNPVFFAHLAERAASGYRDRAGAGLPWPLVFLAIPAVLHKPTRDALPSNVRTSMASWTQSHPLLLASFAERASSLVPLVREALIFGLAHRVVVLDGAALEPPPHRRRRSSRVPWREPTDDYRDCLSSAAFFGRWCGGSGNIATVYALWGVRP